jgi:hypothetical protein
MKLKAMRNFFICGRTGRWTVTNQNLWWKTFGVFYSLSQDQYLIIR